MKSAVIKIPTEILVDGVRRGDKRLLGKAITLVESRKPEHREQAAELLEALMAFTGNSVRIGITGVPGAGKSTFIESFGRLAITKGKKVAVLAIDPSSAINKGSVLGDKTRMEELAKEENAFIRPSPSSGFLGGVANTTFETMLLCEAAGYGLILIETVGVGQSEILVADIADVFLFLNIIGGGDELQGIKRGIMEMSDLIFINKVEPENLQKAKNMRAGLLRALHLFPPKEAGWKVPVILGSALQNDGLDAVYTDIDRFIEIRNKNGSFQNARIQNAQKRFDYWVQYYILEKARRNHESAEDFNLHLQKITELKANPGTEAKNFVENLWRRTT